MKKFLSIILCLSMLMSLVPTSVFAAPGKVPGAQTADETVTADDNANGKLFEGEYTVTYHPGTGAAVTNVPAPETTGLGDYTVNNTKTPQRDGYQFVGWTLNPGDGVVVDTVTVASNVTLFAKWVTKGIGYEFTSDSEKKFTFSGYESEYDYANGELKLKATNLDPILQIVGSPSSPLFFGGDYTHVLVKLKAGKNGMSKNAGYTIRYTSADANGKAVVGSHSDVEDEKRYTWRTLPTDKYTVLDFDFSGISKWTENYITNLRFDIPDGVEADLVTDFESTIDSISVTGGESLEFFTLNTVVPEAAASIEAFGAETVTTESDKYKVKDVEWIGDFVDGKYFKGNTAYKIKVTLVPADGYVLSEAPALASVNRDVNTDITIDKELNRAYIEYEFAATDSLETFAMQVATEGGVPAAITTPGEEDGKLQLEAIIDADISDKGVYWSIDDSQAKYATVDENGLVTAKLDCANLIVTATSKYNPEIKATISINISGQIPEKTVKFDKGVGSKENVTNIPANAAAKGYFELPASDPTRKDYAFRGWSKEVGGEIIYEDDVTEDVTYYANWGYSKGEEFTAANGTFVADAATVTSSSVAGGVLTLVPNNSNKQNGVAVKTYSAKPEATTAIFSKKLDSGLYDYIEVKTNVAPEESEITVGIQSINSTGAVTPANDTHKTTFYSNNFAIASNPEYSLFDRVLPVKDGEFYIYRFPANLLNNWTNTISHVSLNFAKRDVDVENGGYLSYGAEETVKVEYVRFVGRDIPAIDFVNFSIPETKGVATTLDTLESPQLDQVNITSFKWTGALVENTYFNGGIAYKLEIKIKENADFAPLPKSLFRVSINGEALPASEVKYNQLQKMYTITHTFPKTEDLGDLTLVTLKFIEMTGETSKKVFANDVYDVLAVEPAEVPAGYRFLGWSLEENGEIITENFAPTADTNIYAVYEYVTEIDFANQGHREGDISVENGQLSYENLIDENGEPTWAVVTPDSNTAEASLRIGDLGIVCTDYDYVEVIFNGDYEKGGDNKFNENFAPVLNVKDDQGEYQAVLVKAEPVILNKALSYKYIYDLTKTMNDTEKVEATRGSTLGEIVLVPYAGLPGWAVGKVTFLANTTFDTQLVISDVDVPSTWGRPDRVAKVNDNYEIVSVEWDSADGFNDNGSFKAETAYTATFTVKPKTGYKITNDTAVVIVDGVKAEPDSVVLNADGTLTVEKTYPATASLIPFTLTVADAEITEDGASVKLVPDFGGVDLPVKTVTWTIVENGPDGRSATLTEDGEVSGVYNGTVKIKATADYNPDVTAEAQVVITNQIEAYTVTFDPNTLDTTVVMPVTEKQIKLDYVLPNGNQVPTREGFSFAGWVRKPGDVETVTKANITEDTTFYATWVAGINFEFIGEERKLTFSSYDTEYDLENGVLNVEATSNDPIMSFTGSTANPLFFGGDYSHVRVKIKVDESKNTGYTVRYTSADKDGNPVVVTYSDVSDEKVNMWKTLSSEGYTVLDFDFSGIGKWTENYITAFRLDLPDGVEVGQVDGFKSTIDYIRVTNDELLEFAVTGVDAPVAKSEIDTDAVSADETMYKVTKVEWVEPLLYDYYYDGGVNYTAKIYVKGVNGYTASNAPVKMSVNGKEATEFEYDYDTQELIIKYTFPATEVVSDTNANKITFIGKNADGSEAEPIERMVFIGDSFDTTKQAPAEAPTSMRFVGWATTPDADKSNVATITPTSAMTLYAVYETYSEFDFANIFHKTGMTAKEGTVSYTDKHVVVTAAAGTSDSKLVTPVLNLNAQDIAYIEVYYSADYTSVNEKHEYDNRFGLTTRPTVEFTTAEAPTKLVGASMIPVDVQKVTLDGYAPYYKYTYDTSDVDLWNGVIGSIVFDPYFRVTQTYQDGYKTQAYPDWAVRYIRLVPAEATVSQAEISVVAPIAKHTPSEQAEINRGYKVTNVEWSPATAVFEPTKPYTAKVTYKYESGYKFGNYTATINGFDATVTNNDDGTLTASYTFSPVESLIPVTVTITGDNEIKATGAYVQLKAKVAADDGSYIPITDVVWTVTNTDGTDIPYAQVTADGRVYPATNGENVTVNVRATSVYDDTKYAEHTIAIFGQNLCKVTFDKNTFADVTDMPEPRYVYDVYVPENYKPKREGFFFLGWSTDEDAAEPSDSFVIKKDTTLYAKWGKGVEWSFDDEATSLKKYGSNVTVDYVDGVAYYGGTAPQVIQDGTLLSYVIDTKKFNKLQTRFTTGNTTNICIYVQSSTIDGNQFSGWNEAAKINKEGFAPDGGAFQVYTMDLSSHAAWIAYPYAKTIRYDVRSAVTGGGFAVDYVRLLSDERFVRYNANGGLIPLHDGEVTTFKETVGLGNITLPEDPVREGYKFLGWAKDPENYNKLYNDKFPVTDDAQLYAIWAPVATSDDVTVSGDVNVTVDSGVVTVTPNEDQTVALGVADTFVVGTSKTLVIKTDYEFDASLAGSIKLSFIDEEGNPQVVDVTNIDPNAYKKGYIVADFSDVAELTGTIENLEVIFETKTGEQFKIEEAYLSSEEAALELGKDKAPVYVEVVTQQGTDEPARTPPTFPSLPGNQGISSIDSSTTVTPADKPKPTPPPAPKPETPAVEEKPAETFPETASYKDGQFADVKAADWFSKDVEKTFKLGLMTGKSDTAFDPQGTLTLAEAITVAARLNATYYKKTISAAAAGEQWYTPYVKYAVDNKIVKADQFADYTALASRAQVAQMFVTALPGSWYAPINFFTSIADVKSDNAAYKAILMLYNAGIVTGSDDAYSFNPDSNIKRCELSAIINRAVEKESRVRVVLDKAYEDKVITVTAEELTKATIGGCTPKKLALKDGYATATGTGDPIVYLLNYVKGKKAEEIGKIEIGMKINYANKGKYGATVYFTTNGAELSESLSLKTTYKNVSEDGYVTLTFDGSSKKEWAGTFDQLRFDPFNAKDEFGISYVRFLPKK